MIYNTSSRESCLLQLKSPKLSPLNKLIMMKTYSPVVIPSWLAINIISLKVSPLQLTINTEK